MNSGYYAACAGLMAQSLALDVLANNLANLSTTGYRGQVPTFRALLTGTLAVAANPLNRAINNFGVLGGSRIDSSPGSLQRTGSPLDLAIEGAGYFVIQTKVGTRYTRAGNFRISVQGVLMTGAGDPVLGQQGPITVPGGQVSISADGTLSVDGAVADKLRVVEFPADAEMTSEGAAYYSAPDKAATPAVNSFIRQGMLETSNVNAMTATVELIALQRRADMLENALSIYYNNLNRIAADDLPRVQ